MSNARDTAKNLKTGLNVSSFGNVVDIQKDGSTVGGISTFYGNPMFGRNSGARLAFDTNVIYSSNDAGSTADAAYSLGSATSRFTDLYLSGGVYLGGTGSANQISDYEIGTWTPTLPNGGTVTNLYNARYVKIGDFVFANAYMSFNSVPNNTDLFRVSTPFPVTNNSYVYGGGGIGYGGSNNFNDWTQPLVYYGSSHFYFHKNDGTTSSVKNNNVQGNWPFLFSIYYEAA